MLFSRRMVLLLLLLGFAVDAFGPLHALVPHRRLSRPRTTTTITMMSLPLTRASFVFDFDNVPYMDGVRHIHSPEHVATTHRLGAPFFRMNNVDWPIIVRSTRAEENKSSIRFSCSTLATRNMHIRMFTSRLDESNLLFFDGDERRALYKARFTVTPTKAFTGHRMHLDITLFRGHNAWKTLILTLMPVFTFINGMEDALAFHHRSSTEVSIPQFEQYRRAVLLPAVRNTTAEEELEDAHEAELWRIAQRVIREYGGGEA